ncbi:chromate resistance protein ChrB domain-containing protein [Paenibacillus cremeus]|uniref:Chromate resistance protein n=1 Tax=Paenibacillus cremeus TaxID=2163881 RepID=A0A559JVV6_9BACL|nr:chromate resistance protein ChrB domain-containing protein [Paenibacillus cremeus]TVY04013.1 chromate resistance protein [Paenibacillus cremeus]
MKWVTWENVGVDRMACAWLIKRFIDPDAQFIFIPVGSKQFPEAAEPFDIPGVRYSHYRGHCSFHTMVREHQFKDQILDRIASIVDEADTIQEVQLEPAASGLDNICHGLRLISVDDTQALERGYMIYEALYAQIASDNSQK